MPATPAWPPKSTPRLFVDEPLDVGRLIALDGNAANYLAQVMRLGPGGLVRLFDDRTGEYAATITEAGRRQVMVEITERLAGREAVPDLWLCAAPIKKARFDWMAEKACELGIARFQPVLTRRAVVDKVKDDRLRAHMIEAAEQCERTALPEIAPMAKLEALLRDWPAERALFFCDERGGEPFAAAIAASPGPAAILIGPEGGFTDEENAAIRAHPAARPVSLGPRILRADTAAVAAIAVWMACAPQADW